MALPPRLWLPDGTHELPMPSGGGRPAPSSVTPVQRMRRRALWRGEAGLPDRPVLVEWFPAGDLPRERELARRLRGLCHVHLLRLLAIGAAERAYAVSEAPDGVDLFNILRAAPGELPPWWGVAVAQAVTRAARAVESHQRSLERQTVGHGRIHLGNVFVGWDGSVRLLAFSPAGGSGRPDDGLAPELRLSERLLTPAADVFAIGTLLRELLPPSALRRPSLGRLLRRCLHTQADQRIGLAALDESLRTELATLGAPTGVAAAIGEVLGGICPRATVDLLDADWGESTGDGFPALPPTLAPLSPHAVHLSPTWFRAAPPPPRPSLARRSLVSVGVPAGLALLTAAALWILVPTSSPPPAAARPVATPAAARSVEVPSEPVLPPGILPLVAGAAAAVPPLPGLRITVERIAVGPGPLAVVLRLTNTGPRPLTPTLDALQLVPAQADSAAFSPSEPPTVAIGPGRVQRVQLQFPGAPSGPAFLHTLSLRDSAQMPK